MSLECLVPTSKKLLKKKKRQGLVQRTQDQLEGVPSDQINWRQVEPPNKGE